MTVIRYTAGYFFWNGVNFTASQETTDFGANWPINITGSAGPIGHVAAYAGNVVPLGYLECNGAAVSRTTYVDLFGVCGILYGAGDGTTTAIVLTEAIVNAGQKYLTKDHNVTEVIKHINKFSKEFLNINTILMIYIDSIPILVSNNVSIVDACRV